MKTTPGRHRWRASLRGSRAAAAGLAVACLAGCVTVKPVVVDRKTQLENQILGTFERLERELIMASSVRGPSAAPGLSPLEREALEAMLDREFHRDDIDALKAQQVLGEGNDGMLKLLLPPGEAAAKARVEALVERDNRNRAVIMRRAIQVNRDLSDRDLPLVRRIFYRLNVQTARPGHRVQQADGAWIVVNAAALKPGAGPAR